ncbi:hypothetical protein JNUCC0626_13680 [Lentzea sp. JNUCC 0626]|uniref:hypothetical protein n=1 Tax=Lentzea sp. JNUCC 0626 TaxID=3367513 RepID=UPI003748D322
MVRVRPNTSPAPSAAAVSMDPAQMEKLQQVSGNYQTRMGDVTDGLRRLALPPNALGPIGLAAVPALNSSTSNSATEADRAAATFGNVRDGVRATLQTQQNVDAAARDRLTAIAAGVEQGLPARASAGDAQRVATPSAVPGETSGSAGQRLAGQSTVEGQGTRPVAADPVGRGAPLAGPAAAGAGLLPAPATGMPGGGSAAPGTGSAPGGAGGGAGPVSAPGTAAGILPPEARTALAAAPAGLPRMTDAVVPPGMSPVPPVMPPAGQQGGEDRTNRYAQPRTAAVLVVDDGPDGTIRSRDGDDAATTAAAARPFVARLDPERGAVTFGRPGPDPDPAPRRDDRQSLVPSVRLPDFLNDSKALGSVAAVGSTGTGKVVEALSQLLPQRDGVRPKGLDRVRTTLDGDFESFLGEGRRFPVKVGRERFEATIRAELRPVLDSTTTKPGTLTKVDLLTNGTRGSSETTAHPAAGSLGIVLAPSVPGAGPYGSVSMSAPLAKATTTSRITSAASDMRSVRSGIDSVIATLPVVYEVALTDTRGGASSWTVMSDVDGRVDVTVQIPGELMSVDRPAAGPGTTTPGWGERLEHPVPEAVTDLDTEKAFADVAARLHPSITAIGAPGRDALRDFLAPTTIRDNLGTMLHGWVTSPDLAAATGVLPKVKPGELKAAVRAGDLKAAVKAVSDKGAVVQMRARLGTAELLGVHSYQLRLQESTSTNLSQTATTRAGVNVGGAVGFAVRANPAGVTPLVDVALPTTATGSIALTGSVSWRTEESSESGTNASAMAGVQSSGPTGLYKVSATLDIRTPNGANVMVPATAYLRVALPEAAAQGLPVPDGTTPSIAKPTEDGPRFEPPYLASSLAAGHVKVGEFVAANQVQAHVESILRGLKDFDGYLPTWNDPRANARLGDGASAALERSANQRKLDAELSPVALRARLDSLLGPGVHVRLRRDGMVRNDFVDVVVKARLGAGTHVGQADGRRIRGSTNTGPRLDSGTTRQSEWSIGVEGRVRAPGAPGAAFPLSAAVRGGQSTSDRVAAGPGAARISMNTGTANAQVFRHPVELNVEVTRFSRLSPWVHRTSPGSPLRSVPEPEVVAKTGVGGLRPITGEVSLWVTDSSAMKNDPAPFAPGVPQIVPSARTSIRELLGAARLPAPELLHVEAVVNAHVVKEAAIGALTEAARGDRVLALPGSDTRERLDRMFSPEFLRGNLVRLLETGVREGGLSYERRMANRIGDVGVSAELKNPVLVSISDEAGTENQLNGSSRASGSATRTRTFADVSAGVGLAATLPHTANAGTLGAAAAVRHTRSSTRTTTEEVAGTIGRNSLVAVGLARSALVRMDAEFTVVAESRTTSAVRDGEPGAAAAKAILPGSVFVRVNEDVARDLGMLPSTPRRVLPDHGRMAPPGTLGPGRSGTLGLGLVEVLPDVSELLPELRAGLGRLGERLLPESTLDDAMNNLQRLTDLTSPTTVKATIDGALDGGVPLLLHKPGVLFGKDVYQVTLRARIGEAKFDSVVNDGIEVEHVVTRQSVSAVTTANRSATTVTGRVPGSADVRNIDGHSTSATSGGAVQNSVGAARTTDSAVSRTTTDLHLRGATGPAVRYRVPIEFELVVEKGNEVLGTSSTGPGHEMVVRLHGDNQRIADGAAHWREPANTAVRTPEHAEEVALLTWWQSTATPPTTASVEALVGAADLRAAAIRALTEAGASDGLTAPGTGARNALLAALSSEVLQAALPSMTSRELVVPGLHNASLVKKESAAVSVHARLVDPRLAALSDSVLLEHQQSYATARTSGTQLTHTGEHGADLASFEGRPEITAAEDLTWRPFSDAAAGRSDRSGAQKTNNPKPQGRTALVEFGVEYRVVAKVGDRTGVVDLAAPESARLRMPAPDAAPLLGGPIDELDEVQSAVRDHAKSWREAEAAVESARHRAQNAINERASWEAQLTDARAAVETAEAERGFAAEERQRSVAVAEKLSAGLSVATAQRNTLAMVARQVEQRPDDGTGHAARVHAKLAGANADIAVLSRELDAAGVEVDGANRALGAAEDRRRVAVARYASLRSRTEFDDAVARGTADLAGRQREADARQADWWRAKAAVDRSIDEFNDRRSRSAPDHSATLPMTGAAGWRAVL